MTKTKLSEKIVIAIFIALNLWIYNVNAQACIPGQEFFVDFTIIPGEILESPLEIEMERTTEYVSHTEIASDTLIGENYFDISSANDKLFVMTKKSFGNYEKEQNSASLVAHVLIKCTNGDTPIIFVAITFEDVNHFEPKFGEDRYDIKIPLPLPIGVDIFTLIDERISATDYDLQNNRITFKSDITQPISVSTSDTTATLGKEFFVNILTTEKILNIQNGVEFKITATDSGKTEQKSTTVDVKLIAEFTDDFIAVPIFSKSLYTGSLDFTQTPKLNIEIISLLRETFIETIEFKTDLNDGDYFDIDRNGLDNAIQISLKDGVLQEDLNGITQLTFIITATRTDGIYGSAAVLVNVIPKKSLVFENAYYTGTIEPDMKVVHDLIKLTELTHQLDVEFIIKDDPLGWFKTVSTPGVNEMKIELKSDSTDLEDTVLASLSILARSTDGTALEGEARIIFGIKRAELITPAFEKSFYQGVISNLEINDLEDIKLKTGTNIGTISYEVIEHNDLFETDEIDNGVQIKKKKLDEDDILNESTLQFTLTATNEMGIVGSTVVILTIEREELVMPVFQKKLYKGNLKRPFSPATFELEDILIDPHEGVIKFDVIGDDRDLIKIDTETSNSVTLTLVDGVTINADKTVLTVIVTAKLTDAIISSTVVLIHVEEEPPISVKQPKFEKYFYYGSLSESNTLSMTDSTVKLEDGTFFDTVTFEKIGDDAKYFIVEQESNVNNVKIDVETTANLDELADRTTLSFSIQAIRKFNEDVTLIGTSTVVIELPPKIVPTFAKPLYAGSLTTDLEVRLEPVKITTDIFIPGIQYELFEFDSALFDFKESTTEPGTIDIYTVLITEVILKTKQLFKFNVRAKINDVIVSTTSIVIEIPPELESDVIVPQFEQPIYTGILQRDGILILNSTVQIIDSTYSNNLRFYIEDGNNIFSVHNQPGSNIVEISMKPYDKSILQGMNVLHFAVIGKLTDNIKVTTSVVIDVTPMVTNTEPKFIEPLYVGTLNSDMEFSIGFPEITSDTYSNDLTYETSGEDSTLFRVEQANEQFIIVPIQQITEENIRYKTNLRFTLTVKKSNGLTGSTAIIVDIPMLVISEVLPQFESPFYTGSLLSDFSLDLGIIKLQESTYTSDITFKVDNTMFEIDKTNSEDHELRIQKSNTFDELIFKDQKFYSFAVIAELGNLIKGSTTVILDIESPNTVLVPQFEQSLYEGILSATYIPSVFQTIKLTKDSFAPDVTFLLRNDYDSVLFKLEQVPGENHVTIVSNGLNEINTNLRTSLKLVITATKSSNLIGSTVIVINNPNAVLENIIVPQFNKLIYTGTISPELSFKMDDIIEITDATHSDSIDYNIVGGNDLFEVKARNGNIITIGLVRNIEQSDINDKKILSFTLVAALPDLVQGTATVILDITSPNSILPPEFEQSLYIGTLSDNFILDIVDLKLTADSYSTDVFYEKVDDFDSDLFSIPNEGEHIKITSNGITDDDILLKPVLKFAIRAIKPNGLVGTTAVIIHIPSIIVDDFIIPIFEKSIYTGDLSTDFNLHFTDLVHVSTGTYSPAIQFTLEEGNSNLFRKINENGNEFGIALSRPLTASDIVDQNVLSFLVVARLGTFIHGKSTVIIDIETDNTIKFPVFEQSLYIGTLDDAYQLQIVDIKLIGTSYSTEVDFDLVDDFDVKYFEIDRDNSIDNNIKVVSKGITEDVLKTQNLFKFVISATKPNGYIGTTVVMVTISVPNVIIPEFEKSIYRGSLSTELELVSDIYVKVTDDISKIRFNLKDGDSNLFTLDELTENEARIVLKNLLDESDVQGKNELSFMVDAISEDGFWGTAAVIVSIASPIAVLPPVFKQTLYLGTLNTEFELNPISIMLTDESYSDDVDFELVEEFDKKYFEIDLDNSIGNNIKVVSKDITEDVLKTQNLFKFVISATKPNGYIGTTVVIVTIPVPNVIIPEFEKSIYRGSLSTELELVSDIYVKVTDDISKIRFNLKDSDSNLFTLDELPENEARIVLKNLLDESDVQGKNELSFMVDAISEDGFWGTAAVIVSIASPIAVLPPVFKQTLYLGTLNTEFELNPISIMLTDESYSDDVDFELVEEFDKKYFEIDFDNSIGNNIKVVSKDITEDVLKTQNLFKFVISATKPNGYIGTTVVIVTIPVPNVIIPEFEKSIYRGSLSTELELVSDIYVKVTDDISKIRFNLKDSDSNLFTLDELPENEARIVLKNLLDESDVQGKNELSFMVDAISEDGFWGTAAVIVSIASPIAVLPPVFKQTLYLGTLNTEFELNPISIMLTDESYSDDVDFELVEEFDKKYFEIDLDNSIGNNIKVVSKDITEDVLKTQNLFKFVISATKPNGYIGTTVVIVTIPVPNVIIPEFEKSIYRGSLSTELELVSDIYVKVTDDISKIRFNLKDSDSNLFTLDELPENEARIVLKNLLDESDVQGKNELSFMVDAISEDGFWGTAAVIVSIASPIAVLPPVFKQTLYLGTLNTEFELNPISIMLTDESYSDDVDFELVEEFDKKYFEIDFDNSIGNNIKVVSKDITEDVLKTQNLFKFVISATKPNGYIGTTVVIVTIPVPNVIIPEFEKSIYRGSLSTELELVSDIYVKVTDDISKIRFNLKDSDSNLFTLDELPENEARIVLKNLLDESDVQGKNELSFMVDAISEDGFWGTAAVIVSIASPIAVLPPVFKQTLYLGTLNTEFELNPISIMLTDESYSDDVDFELVEEYDYNFFDIPTKTGNNVNLIVKSITEDVIEANTVLKVVVIATNLVTKLFGTTVVVVELRQIPNQDTKPVFNNPAYSGTIEPDQKGYILTVFAEVPADPEIEVIYEVQIEDSELASKIEMHRNTGVLTLTDRVSPGVYNFIANATNQVHNTVGYATIKLTVTSVVICSEGPTVSHSLLVKYLEEETLHNEILDTTINADCEYTVESVIPSSLGNIFNIQGNVLTSKEFDRESEIFSGMIIPQIRLILEMNCNTLTEQTLNSKYLSMTYNRTRAIRSTKNDLNDNYYVYTGDIERAAKKTVLSIVIKDINDQSPVFENPTTADIVLGYPESKLAEKLLPPYLIKVYATDKDEGINAKIRYTIKSNPHFGIHAETGVVYPLKNSMDDELQYDLVVNAIDQDGAGHATPLNIKVKRLSEKNFIIISIEDEILDNLETILQKIEAEVSIRVNVLNAVIVSSTMETAENELRSKRSMTPFIDVEQTVLRIIGYAFNVNGDTIENVELQSKLSEITTVSLISTQNLVDIIGDCDDQPNTTDQPTIGDDDTECDEEDNVGFIIGIIVLALLLLIACIVILLMWWKWIRPYRYIKRDSTNQQLQNDYDDIGYTEPVVAPIAKTGDADIFEKSNLEIKNENAAAAAVPYSSPALLSKSLQSVLDVDNRKQSIVLDKDNLSGSSETDSTESTPPSRERKKSIKFNETVERIDILDNAVEKEDTTF